MGCSRVASCPPTPDRRGAITASPSKGSGCCATTARSGVRRDTLSTGSLNPQSPPDPALANAAPQGALIKPANAATLAPMPLRTRRPAAFGWMLGFAPLAAAAAGAPLEGDA